MPTINEIISKIYNEPSGFGSLKTTLEDARKIDKSITHEDVKKVFSRKCGAKETVKWL